MYLNGNLLRRSGVAESVDHCFPSNCEVFLGVSTSCVQVREHLEDNFDTAGALEVLLNLVKDVKQYSEKKVVFTCISFHDILGSFSGTLNG